MPVVTCLYSILPRSPNFQFMFPVSTWRCGGHPDCSTLFTFPPDLAARSVFFFLFFFFSILCFSVLFWLRFLPQKRCTLYMSVAIRSFPSSMFVYLSTCR
ncbi:hypothetical protein BDW71DRAFT_1519 [Aspergillus fruticulosus]